MEPHLPIKIFFKNLNYGASMFKMQTHPLCRCRQPWGNGSLPAVTVQQWYVFTCCIHTLHIYILYVQAFILRVALYPGQLGEESTSLIH